MPAISPMRAGKRGPYPLTYGWGAWALSGCHSRHRSFDARCNASPALQWAAVQGPDGCGMALSARDSCGHRDTTAARCRVPRWAQAAWGRLRGGPVSLHVCLKTFGAGPWERVHRMRAVDWRFSRSCLVVLATDRSAVGADPSAGAGSTDRSGRRAASCPNQRPKRERATGC